MPIFVCDKCNCIDNTATSNFWDRLANGKELLCSECDPDIGKWHGEFPKKEWDGKRKVYNR